jgi:gliding motility-associated-like protein
MWPSGPDTVTIIIPTAQVDAGPSSLVLGCGVYRDTLSATVIGQTPGVTYNIAWSPGATIVSGGSTLTPIVAPTVNTTYTFNLFTPASQGGCVFTDTVRVTVQDVSVDAGFNYAIRYGCSGDTVIFTNSSTSLAGVMTYRWDFGDGTGDTARNPTHIYTTPGTYAAKLVVTNGPCSDSLVVSLPLDHPLDAAFTPSVDSFCQGDTVFFTNNTIATTRNGIAPRYFWSFGDGSTDTVENPKHYYAAGGVYVVTLSVRDFVPCTDTARDTIVVDSLPFVRILTPDTALCEGEATSFAAQFLAMGNTGLSWDFGDGTGDSGDSLRVTHGYDEPGLYDVVLLATYRKCRDTADTVRIAVQPFPSLNIGSDTAICPGGEPILLTARLSGGGIAGVTNVVWSTRDTASSILVRHHGDYWARATGEGGCSATDSVHVAKDCYLDLPNVFSPNGDGTNDYFWPRQLLSEGVVRFSMRIFNRWGQMIWETTRIDGRGWDGKFNGQDQPTGVYIYLVEAELKNGVREKYQGNVTLLR